MEMRRNIVQENVDKVMVINLDADIASIDVVQVFLGSSFLLRFLIMLKSLSGL